MVELIVFDPKVGVIYPGIVTRVMDFGAFIEIAPGKEGLAIYPNFPANVSQKLRM